MSRSHQYKSKKQTAMDRWRALPEHTTADVIDGVLYVNDAPTTDHQEVATELTFGVGNHIRSKSLGKVYLMDTGVYIDEKNVVQPDFVYISKNNGDAKILPEWILGGPDLILEVLSPSTRKKDMTEKKDFYEKIGVKEYWVVDPITRDSYGYLLQNGKYGDALQLHSHIYVRIFNKTFAF